VTAPTALPVTTAVDYPDDDGLPLADNTLQFQWIVTLHGNLEGLFSAPDNGFVAGNLLWYPVEGNNTIRTAPDVMVVFGRPKGYRGSYRQWEEGHIAPQVAFEVLPQAIQLEEMAAKFAFYERYGVEEYYVIDPALSRLQGWIRRGGHLEPIMSMQGWVSPRLGIQFQVTRGEIRLTKPDGERFTTFRESTQRLEQLRHEKEAAMARAEQEWRAREAAMTWPTEEQRDREAAEAWAQEEQRAKEAALAEVERLAARLRALGIDPHAEP
jgi:Uma2 family endonuclease